MIYKESFTSGETLFCLFSEFLQEAGGGIRSTPNQVRLPVSLDFFTILFKIYNEVIYSVKG